MKDIVTDLNRFKEKTRNAEDLLIHETKRILKQDLFVDKKILGHLKQYSQSFEMLDEEDLEEDRIFSPADIERVAVMYRLKFLESKWYKPEIPYESILKIKHLNQKFRKEVKVFRVLAPAEMFTKAVEMQDSLLFVKTNYDNYYMVHRWGKTLSPKRKLMYWPVRSFENLLVSVITATAIITLVLPTNLITLDSKAEYWSGYRAAAFFHLLIFIAGFTVFFTFAFSGNFSNTIWNRRHDFD